ncbi:hypothetical protein [Methylovirgula sp. 4M-Z18]|uniref:hypothetical protein n=1 Tax=Methylovirgula sp. 4M-Z18 TaxID=2293567 RepID=UPI000E3B455D|nr:hypothetical protein [Methylovirgula sp. 4M-Z18]RFB81420.1 hypothetical protein DYH55_08350 [Methylovirgula sp. 4M-Z18]
MTPTDLKRLIALLGATGAAAGLRESDVVQYDSLIELAEKSKIKIWTDISHHELVELLIQSVHAVKIKSIDELMEMDYDHLIRYFSETAPSNSALLKIMKDLNYKVSAEDKKHLRRFVARQISETALFSKVASGDERKEAATNSTKQQTSKTK